METPLSKREWLLYNELNTLFKESRDQAFDYATYHKYEEWLKLLVAKGVLWEVRADGAVLYGIDAGFDDFDDWIKDCDEKSKRVNRREVIIALGSAIAGAILTSIINAIFI